MTGSRREAKGWRWVRWLLPGVFLAGLCLPLALGQAPALDASGSRAGDKKKLPDQAARTAVIDFGEDGQFRMVLEVEALELESPYGKLLIPVEHLRYVEFATRLTPEAQQRIESSVQKLGSGDFAAREAASRQLLELREKSYPALVKATKHADLEVAHRASELVQKLKATVPAEDLVVREQDVVETIHSVLAGRLTASALPVSTRQFGSLQVQLTDMRSLSLGEWKAPPAEPAGVLPDPGILPPPSARVGTTLRFRVTGGIAGRIWGTGVYATESHLATAAVHAGALREGETGIVTVTIVPSPPAFASSSQNGVVSEAYGRSAHAAAYQIHPRADVRRGVGGRSGRVERLIGDR